MKRSAASTGKWKAGAEYVVTQPVFDLDLLEEFLKRTEQWKLPVIAASGRSPAIATRSSW